MPALTAHFTTEELAPLGAPSALTPRLLELAGLLESFRGVLGVPLVITSGYRSPARNTAVGGVSSSQHLDGTAADFVARGLGLTAVMEKLEAAERAGRLAAYGQLIFYPTSGHIHVSLPTRGKVRERLVKLGGESGGYERLSPLTFRPGEPERDRESPSSPCGC